MVLFLGWKWFKYSLYLHPLDLQQSSFRQADMILYMNVDLSLQSSEQIIREMLVLMVIQLKRHTSVSWSLNQLWLWYDMSEEGETWVKKRILLWLHSHSQWSTAITARTYSVGKYQLYLNLQTVDRVWIKGSFFCSVFPTPANNPIVFRRVLTRMNQDH